MIDFPVAHLSHSSVTAFMRCPNCWAQAYLERRPRRIGAALAIGSSLHGAMAALRRGRTPDEAVEAARIEMGRTLSGEDRTGELPDTDPVLDLGAKFQSWSDVENEALRLVPALTAISDAEQGWEVLAVEHQLDYLDVFDVPFTGFVDVVLRRGDVTIIKDLKSSASNVAPDATTFRQLATYTMALDWDTEHVGVDQVVKSKGITVHPWTDPGYAGEIYDDLRQSVSHQVNWVAAAIQRGDFPVGDGGVFGHDYAHPAPRFYSLAEAVA